MKIFLHNYNIGSKHALHKVGYRRRKDKGDWIRANGTEGRFHAHIIEPRVIDLHYDLFIDNKHVVFPMPITMHTELNRFLRRINWAIKPIANQIDVTTLFKEYND